MPERVSVTFMGKAGDDLNRLAEATSMTKQEVINRAVQIYHFLHWIEAEDGKLLVRYADGETERLKFV